MIRNFLKTSLRILFRHQVYSIINIVGLTTGISACLFIFMWVADEVSFDRFHTYADRIHSVYINNTYPDGTIETYPATPSKLKDAFLNEIPEVEMAAHYSYQSELLIKNSNNSNKEIGIYADPELFNIFSFPITKGNQAKPLTDIKSISISEKLAKKLFQEQDPLGNVLRIGKSNEYIITSVFEDIPTNSSLQFEFVIPFEVFLQENPWTASWQSGGLKTVVLLKGNNSDVSPKLSKLIQNNCNDCTSTAFLFPFVKSRLYSDFENGVNQGGRINQIYQFSTIAILILIMACINFMNLTTARSSTRSREVGIRKTIGAQKTGLVIQFMTESLLISFTALLLALLVVQMLLPFFNEITGKTMALDFSNPMLASGAFLITLFCGLIAGSYPSIILSRLSPSKVLKGNNQTGLAGSSLRKVLVVIQFVTSIVLIMGSITVYRQISFISEQNMGFDRENVIVLNQNEGIVQQYQAIKNDLLQLPYVKNIAFGGNNIFTIPITTTDPIWQGKPANSSIKFKIFRCDADFIPTMNIEVKEGRNFIEGKDKSNYIINKKAAEVMGLSLDNAVGTELEMWNGKGQIVGITDDFHNGNLKFDIEPMILMYSENIGSHYFIKLSGQPPFNEHLSQIEGVFKKHNPDYPFEYTKLEDVFAEEYHTEHVIGKLSASFSFIAIVISCLGLFGLASFTAERRTKEIGIRKVMGASALRLTSLLCKDFTFLVLTSLLIGYPIAWVLIHNYLSGYSFHAEIHSSIYFFTGLFMLLLAVFSVGYQSFTVANKNPVNSLKADG